MSNGPDAQARAGYREAIAALDEVKDAGTDLYPDPPDDVRVLGLCYAFASLAVANEHGDPQTQRAIVAAYDMALKAADSERLWDYVQHMEAVAREAYARGVAVT